MTFSNTDSIKSLPVYAARNTIIDTIKAEKSTIIVGATGSGKTTQIPKFIYESGLSKGGMIAITQPRRVAATSLANRVSKEMNVPLGGLVGYSVRFDDKSSKDTRIKYMTDGMLMREVLSDRMLSRYSVVVLDEAHERTLRTDILFGLLKGIQRKRDLKIVVMSATLDASRYSQYFDNAKILYIEGRQYPVEVYCAVKPQSDYLDAALVTIFQIHQDYPSGDILVFLSGQEEIESLERLIKECSPSCPSDSLKLLVCPLFANLPTHQQSAVFDKTPSGCRKVVLSTNIAETSITISGIRYIVDTGVHKSRGYHPRTGVETLTVQQISQASARQRAGRAGREAAGYCFRLYTEDAFKQLASVDEPEIRRCSLSSIILLLKGAGVDDVVNFEYFDPPFRQSVLKALEELYALGALDTKQQLTACGKQMASFPLEPKLSKSLLRAQQLGCVREVISVIACLSVESLFYCPHDKRQEAAEKKQKFINADGDHLTLLAVVQSCVLDNKNNANSKSNSIKDWCMQNFILHRAMTQVLNIKQQLERFINDEDTNTHSSNEENNTSTLILQSLLAGYYSNVAIKQQDGSYKTLYGNQTVYCHPGSTLFSSKPDVVMYTDIIWTSKCYMRNISRVDASWLTDTITN